MLKFSGYSYLIRGQPLRKGGVFYGRSAPSEPERDVLVTTLGCYGATATEFRGLRAAAGPQHRPGGLMVEMTLEQACPPEYWRAQCAFKDSMIH